MEPPIQGTRAAQARLFVHIKQRVIRVSIGPGTQPVLWLANVAIARYDDTQGRSLGAPSGLNLEDGTQLSVKTSLKEAGLKDGQHVWVTF
mmetsp:Transcript_28972/g.79119  ORF Transcript_28972/g.79119 Transcript_28972/m.79119 type:complete len:90 (-) Transcript_28972:946-1215(-)|eukprot:scaffold233809_cov44-Tisochrysis_lutea.AAC.2